MIWVLPGLVGAAEQGSSCPWHGGCCPQGPKSLGVTLGRKSLPEAVSSHSIQPLQRQICSSKGPLEDAGGQGAARAGPTCTEECPRALWGLWGQLVALPSSEWMAEGAPGAPALPAGIRQGAGSSGSSRWLLLINRLGSFMCPRAACATGAGSWLRASWGSLHPSWRIPGWIQPWEHREEELKLPKTQVPSTDGDVPTVVPTETIPMPRSGFTSRWQSTSGIPFSHG